MTGPQTNLIRQDSLPAIRRDLARKMTHRTIAKRHNMRPSEVRDVAIILKIQGVLHG